jgi:hypothetical protein
MGYQSYKAVCPRCSEQNGSALTPCTNCGKGPIECEWVNFYGNRYKRFRCGTCGVVHNNTLCRKCGADIGPSARKSSSGFGTLLKLVGAGFLLLLLMSWCSNSGGSDSKQSQGYKPSSPSSGSSHWQPGTYTISLNGQEIARGTQVICQIGSNATRIVVGAGGSTTAEAHFGSDGQKGQTTFTQNDNGSMVHWGTLWLDIGTVKKSGNTYNITGTVQRSNPTVQAPYEFNATCP